MKSPLHWLVVASISMVSGISFSQTRYVSTTGSNTSNNCQTPGNPCGTIDHAYSQALPSDTIKIAPGNYNLTSTLSLLQPVVITALNPADRPVVYSTASDVISVSSDDVTISNIEFEMGLTASSGLRGIVANAGNFDNLQISNNVFESVNPISGTPNTNMVWGAFAISLTSTAGDVQNVTIEDNQIIAGAAANVFGRGIFLGNGGLGLDAPGGMISGNTIKAYYGIQSALIADDLLISDNDINGTVLVIAPKTGVTVDVHNNTLGNATQMTPASYYAVLELRSIETADVNVTNNQFNNYVNIGLLSEASKNVNVTGNTFTPEAGANAFTSIMANTKLMTNGAQGNTYSDEIEIKGNTFNAGAAGQGKAIVFADHYGVNTPAFANITIGGVTALEKNTFNNGLGNYIALDELTGASTAFPLWASYPATTMVPVSQDITALAINNNYGLSDFTAIEAKNHDELENAVLGKVIIKSAGDNRYVATTGADVSNDCTLPGNPCATIAHAISVSEPMTDTIFVAGGAYPQTAVLNVNVDGLTITAQNLTDLPVITTNQTTIFDVDAVDASIIGMRMELGLTATTGKYGIVSTTSNFEGTVIMKNEILSSSPVIPYGMVWDAFAIRLNATVGTTPSVFVLDNTIGTVTSNGNNIFGRGISLGSGSTDGPAGNVIGNEVKAYYTIQAIRTSADMIISNNDFSGIVMLNAPLAGTDIQFNGNDVDAVTPMSADSLYALIDIRGIELGTVVLSDNRLTNYTRIGLLSMASKNVTVSANQFTPAPTAAAFTSLMANTKLMTNGVQANTYSDAISIKRNTFDAGANNGGTAIVFADHYGANTPAFAPTAIGGAPTADKNIFNATLGKYIVLDDKTGSSTTFPLWAGYPATTMKAVTQDIEALYIHNVYNYPNVASVELKNTDSVDNNILGKVILAYTFVGLDEVTAVEAKLYPNPATNNLTIELTDKNAVAELTVVDLFGKVVYTSTINGETTIDVSNLTSGVYMVRLNNNGQTSSTRFVKN